jgi:hypothetical protein
LDTDGLDDLTGIQDFIARDSVYYAEKFVDEGRSVFVEISDSGAEMGRLLYQKIAKLSEPNKRKAIQYVDELLQASH